MKKSVLLILVLAAVAANAAMTNLTGVVTFERGDLSFFFIDDAQKRALRAFGHGAPHGGAWREDNDIEQDRRRDDRPNRATAIMWRSAVFSHKVQEKQEGYLPSTLQLQL